MKTCANIVLHGPFGPSKACEVLEFLPKEYLGFVGISG